VRRQFSGLLEGREWDAGGERNSVWGGDQHGEIEFAHDIPEWRFFSHGIMVWNIHANTVPNYWIFKKYLSNAFDANCLVVLLRNRRKTAVDFHFKFSFVARARFFQGV
jgi:hypothetical protein